MEEVDGKVTHDAPVSEEYLVRKPPSEVGLFAPAAAHLVAFFFGFTTYPIQVDAVGLEKTGDGHAGADELGGVNFTGFFVVQGGHGGELHLGLSSDVRGDDT